VIIASPSASQVQLNARLALGTVQLGMPYGVANDRGQPPPHEAVELMHRALDAGIRWIDTAQAYGSAEQIVGRCLGEREESALRVRVVTKLAPGCQLRDPEAVCRAVRRSRAAIGSSLDTILLHDPTALASWCEGLGEALCRCRDEGLVSRIGVSVYSPTEFARALTFPDLDLIQAPYNVLDRRVERGGLLDAARGRGVSVMLRSSLLQGLLLLDGNLLPPWTGFASRTLARWHAMCDEHEVKPLAAAIAFVLSHTRNELIVVGCESERQLAELLGAVAARSIPAELLEGLDEVATNDERLIDPRRWP
jgi:aryl-alcohol dehydrogenase-like predicted oxidoreductase